jgi:cellulose synthase/poly-beta-1,6-N-acetylglucosamine synthase-like glycosyltransferase
MRSPVENRDSRRFTMITRILRENFMSEQNQITSAPGSPKQIVVSVIIPALNEELVIAKCLASLAQQDFPAHTFEVIVVDNGSVDRTIEVARSFGTSLHLTILQKSNSCISALRNLGANAAKGQYLAFLDSDCVAPTDWLSRAVDLLRLGDGGVMGAFYSIPEGSSWVARAWYADMPKLKHGRVSYLPSGTLFVSRTNFLKLNGFDEAIATSEDFEFCQRVAAAGFQVLAFPILSTVHLGTPQTLSSFYRKQLWHGTGVRTAFLRNVMDPGFAKTVLLTMYWLFWMVTAVASVPMALVVHNLALILLAPAFLLLGSVTLAARNAAQRKSWSKLVPLTILYMAYGVARSMSLLGLGKKRTARPMASATLESCARSANVE